MNKDLFLINIIITILIVLLVIIAINFIAIDFDVYIRTIEEPIYLI